MPSRKLTDRCPKCQCKNHLRALHCNQCGAKLDDERAIKDTDGRAKLYADIAHPINSECREMIQDRVIEAFDRELAARQWIAGDRFTIADITAACGVDFARMMKWRPGEDLPNLARWRAQISERPAGKVGP